jgi:hypothetical protein
MAFNDHAVAERVEFLLLLRAKLQQMDSYKDLLPHLDRHIGHSAKFLLDPQRFTWSTNHGLMQLRALLHIASALPEARIGQECLTAAAQRIEDVLPYFIEEDGAVLEAASGYWVYVYEQFALLSEMEVLPQPVRVSIQQRARRFLERVATRDGFLQGMGDSSSRRLASFERPAPGRHSLFSFANGLAGIHFSADGWEGQVLFASLHTAPHVHKLPEDLAVYLYLGQPFFANTGPFAYDNSSGRRFVLSEASQSTVTLPGHDKPVESRILAVETAPETGAVRFRRFAPSSMYTRT